MTVQEVLISLGFVLHDRGNHWRARAIYRPSSNESSLSIYKDSGRFRDFGKGIQGSFKELVKITVGIETNEELEKFLAAHKYEDFDIVPQQPKLQMAKFYPLDSTKNLLPHYSFFAKRGISKDVLDLFEGGVAGEGKMLRRYVFPIFNEHKRNILGFAGRDLTGYEERLKWKLIGTKQNWIYPLFLNHEIITSTREVILVESIGDMLALWTAGYKNVLVLFGIALNSKFDLFNRLVSLNPRRIILGLNDDTENEENNGQLAAEQIRKNLSLIFDKRQVIIAPPPQNDFGLTPVPEIHAWHESYNGHTLQEAS